MVALPVGEAAGEATTDADADGAVFVGCELTAMCTGGTVTTTGAAASAIAAGLLAQGLVPAASHAVAVVRELAAIPADDGPGENTPRAR
jgi:hypothetical protein